jgi:cellulose synthase/poly-beta-1,6-N-acetylglucosamine synthase-like glycosyltransferase
VGIAAASYDWIALTDAGIRLEPSWLEHLVAAVDCDPSVAVVFGNYEPITWVAFTSIQVCSAHESRIPHFSEYGLDTTGGKVRKSSSVFIEGIRKAL